MNVFVLSSEIEGQDEVEFSRSLNKIEKVQFMPKDDHIEIQTDLFEVSPKSNDIGY
jgi:hypothetical protein